MAAVFGQRRQPPCKNGGEKGVGSLEQQLDYILEMEGISKAFSGVPALTDVELKVRRGTVHALMGENGAGKSTMMKILLGIYMRDQGTVRFNGREVHYKSPKEALEDGLAMIHQELSTVQELKVYENIFLGKELCVKGTLLKKNKLMKEKTRELFERLEISIDPDEKMKNLSIARQQLCEIAKAISYDAKLIIMDEPTSAIMESEVAHLFRIIRKLLQEGISIIYITHKMDEVFEISDEISVFRDGCYIGTKQAGEISRDELIQMMVGRTITSIFPKEPCEIGDVWLRVEKLNRKGEFEDVSFEVRKGEILGLAGLMGAGRTEVVETLFGVRKKDSGKVYIDGKEVRIKSPQDAIAHGFSLVTEDRKRNGCFLPLSVRLNTVAASLPQHGKGIFVDRKKTVESTKRMNEKLAVKTPGVHALISSLSGGNQQKVLIGRWLLTDPDILIFDEPTRGIDVGSKSEIHRLLSNLAKKGKCVIIVSSEMPEVMGMSDRILVMSDGKVKGVISRGEFSQERIMQFATGTED